MKRIAYITNNADYVLTVSENSKKDIVRNLNISPEKVVTVYNGVPTYFEGSIARMKPFG